MTHCGTKPLPTEGTGTVNGKIDEITLEDQMALLARSARRRGASGCRESFGECGSRVGKMNDVIQGMVPQAPGDPSLGAMSLTAQAELELELSLRGSLLVQQQRRIVQLEDEVRSMPYNLIPVPVSRALDLLTVMCSA